MRSAGSIDAEIRGGEASKDAETMGGDEAHKEFQARWEGIWSGGLTVGQRWDAGKPSGALLDLLEKEQLPTEGKTVLVPGCGRGYDVIAFAMAGADALGLEISESAVKAAEVERDKVKIDDAASRARFACNDFFEFEDANGGFDIGYDYTFLCAIQPHTRQQWASKWSKLVKSGGLLICLLFPVKPELTSGPPFRVCPDEANELLTNAGFKQVQLGPIPHNLSHPGRGGFEHLGIWERTSSS